MRLDARVDSGVIASLDAIGEVTGQGRMTVASMVVTTIVKEQGWLEEIINSRLGIIMQRIASGELASDSGGKMIVGVPGIVLALAAQPATRHPALG